MQQKKFKIFVILTAFAIKSFVATTIECESVSDFDAGYNDGILKSCNLNATTVINSTGVSLSSAPDRSLTRLNMSKNKKIVHLPEDIDQNFPNLLHYDSKRCSITTISKKNFKGLRKLTKLVLWGNQIEKITKDTFEDLANLEVLSLGKNSC